jgi:hypothetical protein
VPAVKARLHRVRLCLRGQLEVLRKDEMKRQVGHGLAAGAVG